MPNIQLILVTVIFYVLSARLALSFRSTRIRFPLFAAVNIVGVAMLTLLTRYDAWSASPVLSLGSTAVLRHLLLIGVYVGAISVGYCLVRRFATGSGLRPWIAFFYPICLLVLFRYVPFFWEPLVERLEWPDWAVSLSIIGLSYMAFRLSYLTLEIRNGVAQMPTLSEYLGFAFFLPTILIGPISPFGKHQESTSIKGTVPVRRALLRIITGAVKVFFLANIANQLSYRGIFLDGNPHGIFDLVVASVFYYLYLFCNFSGFCDMAIGLAALVGISVKENFDNPFAARNVKEFWNRWHITLSEYVRNVVFAPVSTGLIRKLGTDYRNFSISVAITAVFLVIGVWHGLALHYILFGLTHAAAMIANHYYTIWLKTRLGSDRYKLYNQNSFVNAAAVVVTFVYVAFTFSLFANPDEMLALIFHSVR